MAENNIDSTSWPVKWAKICFTFALISIGIILLNFMLILVEKLFGADNFFSNLIRPFAGIATFCFFPIILVGIFFGGLGSFFGLRQVKEETKKPYFYALTSVVIGVAGFVVCIWGFLYIGAKAWERGWAEGDSVKGPDGYTYCVLYETGLGQDPRTKLIRTKDPGNEDSYEDLGEVKGWPSRVTVIRPVDIAKGEESRLYLKSNNLVFAVSCENTTRFIYDIAKNMFYSDDYDEMSPFILIEKEDVKLYKQDYIPVILRTVKDNGHWAWPLSEALKDGLNHPNQEVRKVAKWLSEIREHGLSHDSETMCEIIDFLIENLNSKDFMVQHDIIEALGFFQNTYIDKAIPELEEIMRSNDKYLKKAADRSLGQIRGF